MVPFSTTTPHTPQHNGIAERTGCTILELTLSVMAHAKAPNCLWAEAAMHCTRLHNRAKLRVGTVDAKIISQLFVNVVLTK